MARPREFDPESALDQAMQVFWAKGYDAAKHADPAPLWGDSMNPLILTPRPGSVRLRRGRL